MADYRVHCDVCSREIKMARFKMNDKVFVPSYGIPSYNIRQIAEVSLSENKAGIIYRIPASSSSFGQFNWVPEESVFGSLEELQWFWREKINHPILVP